MHKRIIALGLSAVITASAIPGNLIEVSAAEINKAQVEDVLTTEEDQDLVYNISKIPLAQRVDQEYLTPVNETQNKDTRVMAISIMNSSTSGNAHITCAQPRSILSP